MTLYPAAAFTTLHLSYLMNGPDKLECFITQDCKSHARTNHSNVLTPFVSYEENEVLQIFIVGLY